MKIKLYLLVAFSFCLLSIRAQVTFNLPFINESAEPELYFLEPNYNKDGHVDYYSLGDMMKVQYAYDDQHRPVRKILYVMDKHDRRWEPMAITDFIYLHNRLASEQTTQLYGGDSPIYKLSKNITYNPVNHTDTIRMALEWLDQRFEGRINAQVDEEGYTIRYLNAYNLPDSSVYIYNQEYYSYKLKHYYTYNKEQLVNCRSFAWYSNSNVSTSWRKVNEYNVSYSKNKVEYTQTTKILDVEENEFWDEMDSVMYEKKLKDITLKYTMLVNQDGRITGKLLTLEDRPVLNSQYTYNKKGQTDVKQEFNLTDRFMRFYGMTGIGGSLGKLIEEVGNLHYTVKHQDNCKQSVFYLKKQKMMEVNTCLYPDGKLHVMEMIRYDDGELDDHDKDEYKYLASGFIEKIEYSNYDEGLEPRRKYLYKEDSEGRVLHREEFSYDDESKQWEAYDKAIYKYDKYGYQCHSETYTYSHRFEELYERSKPGWEGKGWSEWVYDAKKRKLKTYTKSWQDGAWHNHMLEQAAYDDKDRETMKATYEWDSQTQSWAGIRKDSIYYDDARSLTGKIRYGWGEDIKAWFPRWKTETETEENDDAGLGLYSKAFYFKERQTSYTWDNDQWLPDEQRVDNKGRNSLFYSFSNWDTEKQAWRTERREVSETDENGAVLVEKYKWDGNQGKLVGVESTIVINLDENSYSNKRVIYRAWNGMTKTWKDSIACNTFSMGNNDAYIYEALDEKTNRWVYTRKAEMKELAGGRTELKQCLWNAKSNTWEPDRKTVSYYKNNKPFRNETSVYDRVKKQWTPLYCMEETSSKAETIYYKWNTRQQKWVNYLMKKGSGWSEKKYCWNEKTNKFVEVAYYEYNPLKSAIQKEMDKIDTRTGYYSVMGDN